MLNKRLQINGVGQNYESSGDTADYRNAVARVSYYQFRKRRSEPHVARLNRTAVGAPSAIAAAKKRPTERGSKVEYFPRVHALL